MKTFAMSVLAATGLVLGGAPAFAFHAPERGMIIQAAAEVDASAFRLMEWVRRRGHSSGYGEARAEQSLRRFADRSRRFLDEAQSWRGGRRNLKDDFYRLQESWNRVEDSFDRLRPDRIAYGDFMRAREAMTRLAQLSRNTVPAFVPDPPRRANWWEQVWHSHHTGCGHYFWGGKWNDTPQPRYEYHQHREIRTGPARIRVE